MVQHVVERARLAKTLHRVIVATDDKRVVEAVHRFGGDAVLTAPEHACGTDRVAEAVASIDADIVVNVQGDEPMLDPIMIDETVELLKSKPEAGLATLVRELHDEAEFANPGAVKVAISAAGTALYFSRSLIPYPRFKTANFKVFDHIGIYAFTKPALLRFAALGPSMLELIEGLEQLRALEYGMLIAVAETKSEKEALCVDTIEDLERVRIALRRT